MSGWASAVGTFRTSEMSAKRQIADMGHAGRANLDL